MKKRLISLLLAICLGVGMFCGTIPQVSACGLPDYSDTDDRVEPVFCHAVLNVDCYVKEDPYGPRDEDSYLKKDVEVWVILMVVDQGNFFYKVSIEKMGILGYIPCEAATLLHDHEEQVPDEEEHQCAAGYDSPEAEREAEVANIDWDTVEQYGMINKNDVTVRRDIANPKTEDPQLDEDCIVWVYARGLWKGEYWYHISMGEYGEMYVRAKFVTLKGKKYPVKAEPQKPGTAKSEFKKDKGQKQEGSEENAVTEKVEKVEQVEKQGKVSPLDRYLFFTRHGGVMCRAWSLNQSAFQELHPF